MGSTRAATKPARSASPTVEGDGSRAGCYVVPEGYFGLVDASRADSPGIVDDTVPVAVADLLHGVAPRRLATLLVVLEGGWQRWWLTWVDLSAIVDDLEYTRGLGIG